MAEQSGFFADVGGDRTYTDTFLAQWIASFISNGVYNGELGVTAGDHMQVIIPTGRGWINGYYYRNDGDLVLPIANADGVLNRKDIVVLRWDVNARSITAQVVKGTPASNPVAPAIVRGAEQYDLKLAEISIPAGTTAITQDLITDTRLDNAVCGIVHGVVQQVDTTTFYNQIAADLQHFREVNEADFTTWVNGLKEVLNSDTAGNLLNMINDLAGDGRTTESVKGNADAIAALAGEGNTKTVKQLDDDLDAHKSDNVSDADGAHGLQIESGIFTPILKGDSVAGVNTYINQIGRYNKIGKQISIFIDITLSTKDAAMANNLLISGLPFAPINDSRYRFPAAIGSSYGLDLPDDTIQLNALLTGGTTDIKLNRIINAAGTVTPLLASHINNYFRIILSCTYLTA